MRAAVATCRNADERYEACQRMATVIVETIKEKGGCLPQDLIEKGFMPQETLDHWHMAQAMAGVELKLTGS